MDSSKNFCPFVTKLCAVTKLGDLTVLLLYTPQTNLVDVFFCCIQDHEHQIGRSGHSNNLHQFTCNANVKLKIMLKMGILT
jgi:hypothetical protein